MGFMKQAELLLLMHHTRLVRCQCLSWALLVLVQSRPLAAAAAAGHLLTFCSARLLFSATSICWLLMWMLMHVQGNTWSEKQPGPCTFWG